MNLNCDGGKQDLFILLLIDLMAFTQLLEHESAILDIFVHKHVDSSPFKN